MVFANWRDGMLQTVRGRVKGERPPRHPALIVEEQALGPAGSEPHALRERGRFRHGRVFAVQSLPAAHFHAAAARREFRARLEDQPARRGGWRASRRQHAGRSPKWPRPARPSKAIGTRRLSSCSRKCGARCAGRNSSTAARFSKRPTFMPAGLLMLQRQYASWAGMGLLDQSLAELEKRLESARAAWFVPAPARLGRRTDHEERLARFVERGLPADPAAIRDLQSGAGDQPAVPEDAEDRVSQQ